MSAGASIPDRPLVELPPARAPGGRSVPPDDLTAEVDVLAALLAELVLLAGDRAMWPSRLEHVAELALEHGSVRMHCWPWGRGELVFALAG